MGLEEEKRQKNLKKMFFFREEKGNGERKMNKDHCFRGFIFKRFF